MLVDPKTSIKEISSYNGPPVKNKEGSSIINSFEKKPDKNENPINLREHSKIM